MHRLDSRKMQNCPPPTQDAGAACDKKGTIMRTICLALLLILTTPAARSQAQPAEADPWAAIRWLVGNWQGTATGQSGDGTVVRRYEFVLNNKFMHETNLTTYPPQEKNKKGEIHEHRSYISYDKARKLLVLRQFHVEGFVNQFVLNRDGSTPTRLVFDSENFENFSNKWRARETYDILGPDEFTETFELAPPDKPFETYSKNRFKRAGH